MGKLLSVIVPTYNERGNIVRLIERAHRALSGASYEIVVVDDNSRDGTAEAAFALADRYPVRVIVRKNERGLATAVVEGLRQSDSPVAAVMDADLQHPPEILAGLLKAIDAGADMAVGSRYVPGGGTEGWSLVRRIVSKGAIMLAHLLVPSTRRIRDASSGFFMFRREALGGAEDLARLKPTGWKILLEVFGEGRFEKVAEVPYVFVARSAGESKLNARQQVDYLKHLLSLMRRQGELARFGKFLLVGASGVAVNEGLLWLLRDFAGLPLWGASAIAVEASILSNFFLNDAFTFADRRESGAAARLKRLGKFNVVSLAGLGINVGVLLLLTNLTGVHYLLANLAAIAVATLWNYFVNSRWTWK